MTVEPWVTLQDVAKHLQVADDTVHRWIARNLRNKKYNESLENACISSAGDFYTFLNRMAKESDFKRLLTEFALGDFRRGIAESDEGGFGQTGSNAVIADLLRPMRNTNRCQAHLLLPVFESALNPMRVAQ